MRLSSLLRRIQEFYHARLIGLIFLLPAVLCFAFFSWRPVLWSFWISFHRYDFAMKEKATFIGWENYRVLLADQYFYQSWFNVVLYVVLGLLIGYLLPVVLAIAVNEMRHLKGYLRLGLFLPAMLPLVVVAIMWKYLYTPSEGLFDSIVKLLGFEPVRWLQNGKTAILSLVIMSTWKNAGWTMIVYLAGLQGVPPQLYEAAEIDGANLWQRIRHVTIPQLLPLMLIMLILQIIGTFQIFTEPFIMTEGGPANKTLTVLMRIYHYAFRFFDYGVATAMGLTLFVVLVSLSIIWFVIVKRMGRST